MQAALPMGSNKITGLADPTVSTDAATKNYVDTQASFSTGDVKLTLKTVADSGWLLCLDQTFGSASSNATFASATSQALFLLIYANVSDAAAPVLTSSGVLSSRGAQGSAATAWAANCQLTLPKMLGRALAVAGSGASLTTRALGSTVGSETVTLLAANVPQVSASVSGSVSGNFPGNVPYTATGSWGGTTSPSTGGTPVPSQGGAVGNTNSLSSSGSMSGTAGNVSPTGVAIMPPETFLTAMIKL
jgi:microcystin-dependent protein